MRSRLATCTLALLFGTTQLCLAQERPPTYLVRPHTVRSCRAADSAFGHMWRSQVSRVPAFYDKQANVTILTTPLRTISWQVGSSRLAGTELRTQVPGKGEPGIPPTIVLSLRIVDTMPREGTDLPLILTLDDTIPFELANPQVVPVSSVRTGGTPLYVSFDLTLEKLRWLAGAKKAEGTLGPHHLFFYDWELLDINAVYRGVICGVRL